MASQTLKPPLPFPVGATVTVYAASDWPVTQRPPSGSPPGTPVTTAVVASDGTVTFSGLADGTSYYAYLSGSYVGFATLGDTEAFPTASSVGSKLSIWDATGGQWNRHRQIPAIGSALATSAGIAASGLMAEDAIGGNYKTARMAGRDAETSVSTLLTAKAVFNGATHDRARAANTFKTRADAAVTAGTAVALWTPAASKKFRALKGQLSLAVAGQIILKDGATEILRSPQLAAGTTWTFDLGELGKLSSAANNVLNVDTSATGNIGGWVGGTEE